MFIETILFAASIFLLYKYLTRNFDYWKERGVQSIKPTPIFGNVKDVVFFKSGLGHFLAELYNKTTADFFGIWIFNTPYLVLRSPELIKHVLQIDFNYFSDRAIASDENADPVLSRTLLLLPTHEWKSMRTKVTPLFTMVKIKSMLPLIEHAGDEMSYYLSQKCLLDKSIDAKDLCAKFTVDVITSCSFGVDAHSFRNENAAFKVIADRMFDFNILNGIRGIAYFFVPSIVKYFRLSFFHPSVNSFCEVAIKDAITARQRSNVKRNDAIDSIIAMKKMEPTDGIEFDEHRATATAIQFFVAGYESTSTTISFALYELCLQPDIQDKLRREIKQTVDEYNGINYESIHSMKYLDMIVKEVLRKYPTLPFLGRFCMKDYKIPGSDVIIEKGMAVKIPLFGLHYDPQYYPDPEKFDPQRFTSENVASRPSFAFLPFGGGPRNCIGERMGYMISKFGIIKILSSFRVERTEETPVPIVFDTKTFVLKSTVGLPMRFVPCEL